MVAACMTNFLLWLPKNGVIVKLLFNLLKNFLNVDLGGFWICCCRNGTTSFGTKFTSIPIISGFN